MSITLEQVESLIAHAQRHARETGIRQRVEAVPMPRGPGWYYQCRDTGRWPHRLWKGLP